MLVAALALAAALALPLAALASTAARYGSSIFIVAGAEANRVTVGTGVAGKSIRDTAGISAGNTCEQVAADMVSCGALDAGVHIYARLGAGNDHFGSIAVVAQVALVDGGSGNDVLYGDSLTNELRGGPGKDVVNGSAGNDILVGGSGYDRLLGGAGNDMVFADDGVAETVDCGKGARDTARVDPRDRVVACEKVLRAGE